MKRVPRLLLVAFALSLLLHLIVALGLRPPSPTPETQGEVVSIQHRPASIASVKHSPTPPPPRPARTAVPRAPSSAPPVRRGPGSAAVPGGGNTATPAPIVARVTPAPAATATPGCAHTDVAAAVTVSPSPPDIPTAARGSGTSGTALVNVQLDASGRVTGTNVTQSTGNSSLDLVAVGMARDAQYSAALRDCKPIASNYTYSVRFVAW